MVDGLEITDPAHPIDPSANVVLLDGERLKLPRLRYYLINKPKGVVCTNADPGGRPKAVDLVPDLGQRLFTVGRLDENTEGLLLVTNDGELSQKLAHPKYEVVRRYRAIVAGVPDKSTFAELRRGMHFSDGFFHFTRIRPLRRKGRSMMVELEMQEGRNREIRRLFARVGHKVLELQRVAFGPLRLGDLPPGAARELRPFEVEKLREFAAALTRKRRRKTQAPAKTADPTPASPSEAALSDSGDEQSPPYRTGRKTSDHRKAGSRSGSPGRSKYTATGKHQVRVNPETADDYDDDEMPTGIHPAARAAARNKNRTPADSGQQTAKKEPVRSPYGRRPPGGRQAQSEDGTHRSHSGRKTQGRPRSRQSGKSAGGNTGSRTRGSQQARSNQRNRKGRRR